MNRVSASSSFRQDDRAGIPDCPDLRMKDVFLGLQGLGCFAQKVSVPRKKPLGFGQQPLHFAAQPGFLLKFPGVGVPQSGIRVEDGIVAAAA